MSERDGYQHGVPIWVDTWQPDGEAAVAFYGHLFGWEIEETSTPGAPRRHWMCNLRGRRVCGIGSPPPVPDHTPVWGTYVWTDDLDDTLAKAKEAGGKLAMEPFEALDGGRIAVLIDPSGGVIAAWQIGENNGAQVVNEPGAWSMSSLHTRDTEAAAAFYNAVFGWTTESFGEGAKLFRLPGFEGGEPRQPVSRETVAVMSEMGDDFPDDVPPHWGVDFWVTGADATAKKAAELGGTVRTEPFDTPGFRSAVLADPQGAVFTVSQLLPG